MGNEQWALGTGHWALGTGQGTTGVAATNALLIMVRNVWRNPLLNALIAPGGQGRNHNRATAGIGAGTVGRFAGDGSRSVLVDRDASQLQTRWPRSDDDIAL
ncbi:hypothetical protein BH20CHL4_BH20CHL4_08180 [soil metagenome]